MIGAARERGFGAFKLRVGFAEEIDRATVDALPSLIMDDEIVAIDANQSWDLPRIRTLASDLRAAALAWVEEPLPADAPPSAWREAARLIGAPMALGENLRSFDAFRDAIDSEHCTVVQPDICKWGGLSTAVDIARDTITRGKVFYPHFLGSALGLIATAHLVSAGNPLGFLETDVNENGLRDDMIGDAINLTEGCLHLPNAPGLGVTPSPEFLREYQVVHEDITAE